MGDAHPVDLSEGSWDPYIDNWADLYQEAEHELPKVSSTMLCEDTVCCTSMECLPVSSALSNMPGCAVLTLPWHILITLNILGTDSKGSTKAACGREAEDVGHET